MKCCVNSTTNPINSDASLRKILIFGNSGSGKSTLAKELADKEGFAHLDLDTLAWLPVNPPERAPLEESERKITGFIEANDSWVIEGCYADLIEIAGQKANEVIFLNLSIDQCLENAKARPWEPHKYESKKAQDNNLSMLLNWIKDYEERADSFSLSSHFRFFEGFHGRKIMYIDNARNT